MKLISNRALREFAAGHPLADTPLRAFKQLVESGNYHSFAELRAAFRGVDKVGERYVFNVGGNKYRIVAGIAFSAQTLWIKAVMTHTEYDQGGWK